MQLRFSKCVHTHRLWSWSTVHDLHGHGLHADAMQGVCVCVLGGRGTCMSGAAVTEAPAIVAPSARAVARASGETETPSASAATVNCDREDK